MHEEAYAGFTRMLELSGLDPDRPWRGLDVGGADVNGSVRGLLPATKWTGLDIEPAPGVDIVANAATWRPDYEEGHLYDVVIATELFEHTPEWREIITTMRGVLDFAGPQVLITTCASDGRAPHGARGEWGVPKGQHYGNVTPSDLRAELEKHFFEVHVEYNPRPGDAYAFAKRLRP